MTVHITRDRAAFALAGVLLTAAPAAYAHLGARPPAQESAPAPTRGTEYVETRLFFGTERPDGGPAVTERQFGDFVDKEVTPGFPGGLTVLTGRGQWRDTTGTIEKERSYQLILLYPVKQAAVRDRRIERVRRAYEKAFAQESVGRVDDRARADF
ncbi:DUF3574 domain-containing protein [Streptomyces sp. NPDC005423]|uniref:DUF3574 domain-containing protein n=1 Tax=Streptomyces sp. NPDC005423 TaxID=3155343 RepID=UPI0033B613E9